MPGELPPRRRTSGRVPLRKEVTLPLVPRNLSSLNATYAIEIKEHQGRYHVKFDGLQGHSISRPSALSLKDMADAHDEISSRAQENLRNPEYHLYELARAGYYYFCQIFTEKSTRSRILELVEMAAKGEIRYIVINSNNFSLPWSYLYLKEPRENVDTSYFLGNCCVVVSNIVDPSEASPAVESQIRGPLDVLAGWSEDLPYCCDFEVPFLRRHSRSRRAPAVGEFYELPELVSKKGASTRKMDTKARSALFDGRHNLVHLACHGVNGTTVHESHFRLRSGYPLTQEALFDVRRRFKRNPVIFLNACEMGMTNPLSYNGIVSFFLDRGARTIIAPTCQIPDRASALFAYSFYKFFAVGGNTILESLVKARRELVVRAGSLIGLAYAVYGQPTAQVVR